MRRLLLVVPALGLFLAAGAPAARAVEEAPAEPLSLPLTIGSVWYEFGKPGGGTGRRKTGDLTLTDRAVEFAGPKRLDTFPLETIRVLSYGKFGGDVDTDWAVLEVVEGETRRLVAFRDGRKLGYGGRSQQIHETLLRAMRQLRAAQYAVPDGFAAVDTFDEQFTVAVPEAWKTHVGSIVLVDGRAPWGAVVFYPSGPGDAELAAAGMRRPAQWLARASPSLFVDRSQADRGSSCKGLSESERTRLVERLSRDYGLTFTAEAAPSTLDGCAALRLVGASGGAGGAGATVEAVAAVRGDTLFVLGRTAPAGGEEAVRGTFETFVSTLRFSVALP